MNAPPITLRHLCFTGPEKEPATLRFDAGLNVIYGASNTGKSFVLDAIDFMLGGSRPLEDISELVGYDELFLGLEAGGEAFTLARSTAGGEFHLYEGMHEARPKDIKPTRLASKHSPKRATNVSRFLLGKILLDGKVVRESSSDVRTLSFRDLSRLCLVNEGSIQKRESPIETGQVVSKTVELAVFKLLLTGLDDAALVAASRDTSLEQSRGAKLELIDELIAEAQREIAERGDDALELSSQLERIELGITVREDALRESEQEYDRLVSLRDDARKRLANGVERRGEIDDLLARFQLLDEHYKSDLARLEAIRESGTLLSTLAPQVCPLCGSHPEQQHRESDCEGNLEQIVAAAEAETAKIDRLRKELADTTAQLHSEARTFDRLLPRLQEQQVALLARMTNARPSIVEHRSSYTDLIEERAEIRTGLAAFEHVSILQARRSDLERTSDPASPSTQGATAISSTTLDDFSQYVLRILQAWRFPGADRVHFEMVDRDVVIDGQRRGSRGKGLRAITHTAFTLALVEYCKRNTRQHPGFMVVDSPLLAYWKPEGTEDDLRGTEVHERFYEHLAAQTDRQFIIIENIPPPAAIAERPTTYHFTGNPHQGRFGLFPVTPPKPDLPEPPQD